MSIYNQIKLLIVQEIIEEIEDRADSQYDSTLEHLEQLAVRLETQIENE